MLKVSRVGLDEKARPIETTFLWQCYAGCCAQVYAKGSRSVRTRVAVVVMVASGGGERRWYHEQGVRESNSGERSELDESAWPAPCCMQECGKERLVLEVLRVREAQHTCG